MWLESINIGFFRNFTEEQHMTVERDVTCLIGKNESGKTIIHPSKPVRAIAG